MASAALRDLDHRDRGELVVCGDYSGGGHPGREQEITASANTLRASVTSLIFMLVAVDAVPVWFHIVPF